MTKKKILHIVEAFGGGIFSFLTDLIDETKDDFEIYIAYSLRDQTPYNFQQYFDKRVHFIKVESFGRSINPVKDLKAFFELKKIVKEVDPDIVHLHSSKAGFAGRFAVNCKKRRVLYNPHGFSFLMQDSSALKRKIYYLIEKIGCVNNATIVGCSYGEYLEAKKLTKNAICINNGVNVETMDKLTANLSEHKIDTNNLKACTTARISFQKQPAVFNKVAESFTEMPFVWIGDGELREELTSNNIEITGWKTKEEAVKLLNDSDIFMLTSAWEGLPISLLEAMYMGKICIVSNCIGNRDVIKDGVNGFVCNNANEFVQAINKVRSFSEEDVQRMTSAAKADVLQNYNIRKNVKQKYVAEYLKH